jgi:hypothetical protein
VLRGGVGVGVPVDPPRWVVPVGEGWVVALGACGEGVGVVAFAGEAVPAGRRGRRGGVGVGGGEGVAHGVSVARALEEGVREPPPPPMPPLPPPLVRVGKKGVGVEAP